MAEKILELCTSDDALAYPGLGTVADKDKQWIAMLVRDVSKTAENYCNRLFYNQQRTRQFSPLERDRIIRLPAFGDSANTIDNVWESSDQTYDSTTLLDSTSYVFDWETGALARRLVTWRDGPSAVQVQWTAGIGIVVEDVPEDLRAACVRQVVYWFSRRADLGIRSKSIEGGRSVTIFEAQHLIPEVREVFDFYRTPGFGV